jgi:hypothetical protein
MKTLYLMRTITLRLAFVAGLNLLPAREPIANPALFGNLGFSFSPIQHTSACTITAIRADAKNLDVEFTGQWAAEESLKLKSSELSVLREPSVSQVTWKFLVHRFSEYVGKPITITVHRADFSEIIRGGVPLHDFNFPQDRFEITPQKGDR